MEARSSFLYLQDPTTSTSTEPDVFSYLTTLLS
jgi:hypothetical protein